MPSLRNGGIRRRLLALVSEVECGFQPVVPPGDQPFSVKLPGEFGCAQVAALHRPAALLEPRAHLLLPFIVFGLLCSYCCFVLYHLTPAGATSLLASVFADVHVAPVATLNSTRILRQNCAGRARGDR